jgi:peroxin-7
MQAPPTSRLRTPGFAHHSLKFSPFYDHRLAVASGANFGLIGNGRVHLLQMGPQGLVVEK